MKISPFFAGPPRRRPTGAWRSALLTECLTAALPDAAGHMAANIKRDGCLASTPLVWNDTESGRLIVLSGNHRTLAAIEAGLRTIWWMQ
ncbi:hypothetical protein ABZW18_05240 [Streptomyces sp. NPDC004647]|uniref:hypothetical protein n=1 Tax=Streptomyces sp. NPDC004647 TaxID=3154671 RepID=UPI0033A90D7B